MTPSSSSSSALEGSQLGEGDGDETAVAGPHQPWRVRNCGASCPRAVVIWSSSALEGSQPKGVGGAGGAGVRSSPALEGSQPGIRISQSNPGSARPHQPWRVRNDMGRSGCSIAPVVLISPGGFATPVVDRAGPRARGPHQPWRVRNRVGSIQSPQKQQVLISPGGFATPAWSGSTGRRAASSSALEGSQQLAQARGGAEAERPHQPWRVRNAGGGVTRDAGTAVLISPGGFATAYRAGAPGPRAGSSSALEGSQREVAGDVRRGFVVLISPGGFATAR